MRLVSLCPSITESLVEMGLVDQLVGITRYCIHPRDVVKRIRKVGGTKNPDVVAILALAPDLVFLNAEENRAEDVEAISRMLPTDVSHPRAVAEVPDLLRQFGRLTGREPEAESWARRIEARLAEIREKPLAAFRFVYLIWKEPWMTVDEGTYISDLLTQAGGVNAFAGRGTDYPQITQDEIRAARPDVLLLPDEPYRFRPADRQAFAELLPESDIRLVSGDDLCWHGVRTLRGIEAVDEIARSLHTRLQSHPQSRAVVSPGGR